MKGKFSTFVITIISIIASYYISIFIHEWSHGLTAWYFGYKPNPFQVMYGGWLLLNVDEGVHYGRIVAAGNDLAVALIGIAGVVGSMVLFLISLGILKKMKRSYWGFSLFYWISILCMVPIFQYLLFGMFTKEGDSGRFVQGLHISPWWVFVPGLVFVVLTFYYFFKYIIPKAYVKLFIKKLWTQRLFLILTLFVLFGFDFVLGYRFTLNTSSDKVGVTLEVISIIMAIFLFFLCNPSNHWIQRQLQKYEISGYINGSCSSNRR